MKSRLEAILDSKMEKSVPNRFEIASDCPHIVPSRVQIALKGPGNNLWTQVRRWERYLGHCQQQNSGYFGAKIGRKSDRTRSTISFEASREATSKRTRNRDRFLTNF